jgi:hypothetical protein
VPIVFRWSVWGDKRGVAETLPYSVGTFRRAFGSEVRYVIATDEPSEVRSMLPDSPAEILPYGDDGTALFSEKYTCWRKWCPHPRLFPDCTEFYVDADIFLLGDPLELRRFGSSTTAPRFLVMQEGVGQRHCVGVFRPRVLKGIPPVNTGLVGQRPGGNITQELLAELQWWLTNVPSAVRHTHDDQGAVIAVLSRWYLLGQVELLPQERYFIFRPKTKDRTLDGMVAIHATRPGKPAFHRFRAEIEQYMLGNAPVEESVTSGARSSAAQEYPSRKEG